MKLKDLFSGYPLKNANMNFEQEISNICIESNNVTHNSVFFAMQGREFDGNNFANEAISKGAIAVVSESKFDNLPYVQVEDVREAYAIAAANISGNAHKKLKIIGVVGTNGKTTTSTLLFELLRGVGISAAVIGTLGCRINDKEYSTDLTTPDPPELHEMFRTALEQGVEYIVMEVSAHAIYYKKIYGITFEMGIFTNCSQDHLDFFSSMDEYAECKKSFFSDNVKLAVVNVDDSIGREIITENKLPVISYGLECPSDAFAIDVISNAEIRYTVNICDKIGVVKTRLYGMFNAYNTLAALTAATVLGFDFGDLLFCLRNIPPINGRYNVINADKKVIIDYAHTPDGLRNILSSVKEGESGKIISVFGCGGNRDRKKRRLMGEISGQFADMTVITTDNSRLEDPYAIMEEIAAGLDDVNGNYQMIRNREDAIEFAITVAGAKDVIVVAGKGAENYIDEGGVKKPYSDYETVHKYLRRNKN